MRSPFGLSECIVVGLGEADKTLTQRFDAALRPNK
jgi:hypothetical protein